MKKIVINKKDNDEIPSNDKLLLTRTYQLLNEVTGEENNKDSFGVDKTLTINYDTYNNFVTSYQNTYNIPVDAYVEVKLYVQVENTYLKETINILKSSNIDYEFRTTLVEEFHKINDIIEIGILLNNEKILYLQHFVDHGTCLTQDLHEVDLNTAINYQKILKEYIKEVKLRGY